MTWFAVDDHLHGHIKARRAGAAAMGLWVLAGSYCADNLTDGFVAADVPAILVGKDGPKLAARLVTAKLWHVVEGGWRFHDWAEYQPTAESVRAKRAAAKDRMTRVRSQAVRANNARTNREPPAKFALPVPVPVPEEGGDTRARPRATPTPRDEGSWGGLAEASRCPSEERPNEPRGDELLDALARGSGGCFCLSASATQLVELGTVARAAHPRPLTVADFDALGRACAAGAALAWMQRPSLGTLLRNGAEHLLAGIDEARAWAATQAPAAPVVKLVRPEPAVDLAAIGEGAREALATIRGSRRAE